MRSVSHWVLFWLCQEPITIGRLQPLSCCIYFFLNMNINMHFLSFSELNWHRNLKYLEILWKTHDDVIKWKHFPRYWPFVRGIHRSSVNSPHKGQWREALLLSLICAWTNGSANHQNAGDLRLHRAHDVTVMLHQIFLHFITNIFCQKSATSVQHTIKPLI